jgi:tRNA G18 (ribose-2'-O)-methylase SpoU
MPLFSIADLADSRLNPYRDLTTKNLTRKSGLFIAEGEKVVERLIASDFEVDSLLVEPDLLDRFAGRLRPETPVYQVNREQMVAIAGFQFHRGILACGRRKPLDAWRRQLPPLDRLATTVVCPDVQDPTNLGSILRSSAAFGADAVLVGPLTADPFSRRVLRVSMGAAFRVPIGECDDLARGLLWLRDRQGFELVATVCNTAAEDLASFRRPPRVAVLFGSEGHGLGQEWIDLCSRKVTIPMSGTTDSLNVSVAAAVTLYQVTRAAGAASADA